MEGKIGVKGRPVTDDDPPERDARVLGSRHKVLCNEWAAKGSRNPLCCFCDACLGYELRNNLVLRSLAATNPSSFRNIGIFMQYHFFLTRWPCF